MDKNEFKKCKAFVHQFNDEQGFENDDRLSFEWRDEYYDDTTCTRASSDQIDAGDYVTKTEYYVADAADEIECCNFADVENACYQFVHAYEEAEEHEQTH